MKTLLWVVVVGLVGCLGGPGAVEVSTGLVDTGRGPTPTRPVIDCSATENQARSASATRTGTSAAVETTTAT